MQISMSPNADAVALRELPSEACSEPHTVVPRDVHRASCLRDFPHIADDSGPLEPRLLPKLRTAIWDDVFPDDLLVFD